MTPDRLKVYRDSAGRWVVDWGDPRGVVPARSWRDALRTASQIRRRGGSYVMVARRAA